MTFGLIVSILLATHMLAYNSGIQTGVIMTAMTVNIADAVSDQHTTNKLKRPSEEDIRGFDFHIVNQ